MVEEGLGTNPPVGQVVMTVMHKNHLQRVVVGEDSLHLKLGKSILN